MGNFVELKGISKCFGDVRALHRISLEIKEGECLGLLGPSGCGKTTLLRLIAGFEEPDSGEIIIDNQTVCSPKNIITPQKRKLGMVFQDLALWPHMTVKENVAFGLKGLKLKKEDVAERLEEVLNTVSLNGQRVNYPHMLSGGEKQRAALARAIVLRPRILLLDEPLSNLDPLLKEDIKELILKVKQEYHTTLIYVTHDQGEVVAIADRIVVMKDGGIEQIGTKEEIYSKPETEFVKRFFNDAH